MNLENYDPNTSWGKHTIKVSFQKWGFKGYVTFEKMGNCQGLDILNIDSDDLYDMKFKENPVKFTSLDENWYRMVLTNDQGVPMIDEDEFDFLGRSIVGVEIIGFEEGANEF